MLVKKSSDEGLPGVSLQMSGRSRLLRLTVAGVIGLILGLNFGPTGAGVWLAANLVLEVMQWVRHRHFLIGRRWAVEGLGRVLPAMGFTVTWSVMGAAAWIFGGEGMRVFGLIVLFGVMVESLKYGSASRFAFLVFAPTPIAVTAVTLTFLGGLKGWALFGVVFALAALIAYVLDTARILRQNARALEEARAEALAANAAKTAFLAMMSHELRTPLNGVLGMANALAATDLDERQADYLDMIVQSGDGLLAILNDILDLSKIEAGKLELETVGFDLHKLARQLRQLWSETARAKGVDLRFEIDPATPAWLEGDPTRLRQILQNLISNALKFTEYGEVVVGVAPLAGGGVEIVVRDTGIGMTPEQVSRLFQAFSQGETSITRRYGGTGLGLSICRRLAEMMGGDISVASEPGLGSTFRVVLPLAQAHPDEAVAEADGLADLSGRRLLVVDDNAVNRAVARAVLEAAGALVSLADDGAQGLDAMRAGDFDLVLMDVHMPVMDGIEALRRIRAGEAGDPAIPVMALTADAMTGEGERLMALGFDDAHPKPIRPADLLQAVAACCRRPPALARAAAG